MAQVGRVSPIAPSDAACLRDTALYLLDSSKHADVRPEARSPKLGSWFQLASLLRLPAFLMVLLGCVRLIWRPANFSRAGHLLLEDHSSLVIADSLKRVLGENVPKLQTIRTGRVTFLREAAGNISMLAAIYREVDAATDFDRTRTLKLLTDYLSCRALLRDHAFEIIFLARTNDQKRSALGVAATERRIPVVAWTVERRGFRASSPFPLAAQLCWGRSQLIKLASQGVEAYQMPVARKPINNLDAAALRNGKLGFLLNARVDIPRLVDFLRSVKDVYGIRDLQLRPHPGKDLGDYADVKALATLRDWREPLTDFLDSVQAAMAMSSGSIDDALWRGVPVIVVGGLDDLPAEYCGMVSAGVLPLFRAGEDPSDTLVNHYADWQESRLNAVSEYSSDPSPERTAIERFMPKHVR
jgi:hypothetical protein